MHVSDPRYGSEGHCWQEDLHIFAMTIQICLVDVSKQLRSIHHKVLPRRSHRYLATVPMHHVHSKIILWEVPFEPEKIGLRLDQNSWKPLWFILPLNNQSHTTRVRENQSVVVYLRYHKTIELWTWKHYELSVGIVIFVFKVNLSVRCTQKRS